MSVEGLRVVRFAGTGAREYHDLGFCIPVDDGTVVVIYKDREARVSPHALTTALHVNVKTMLSKTYVHFTVTRDFEALRLRLPEEEVRFRALLAPPASYVTMRQGSYRTFCTPFVAGLR